LLVKIGRFALGLAELAAGQQVIKQFLLDNQGALLGQIDLGRGAVGCQQGFVQQFALALDPGLRCQAIRFRCPFGAGFGAFDLPQGASLRTQLDITTAAVSGRHVAVNHPALFIHPAVRRRPDGAAAEQDDQA